MLHSHPPTPHICQSFCFPVGWPARYATEDNSASIQFSVSDSDCGVQYLEHVVVQMTLAITVKDGNYYSYNDYFSNPDVVYHSGARRGDISVEMYSPYGTRYIHVYHG